MAVWKRGTRMENSRCHLRIFPDSLVFIFVLYLFFIFIVLVPIIWDRSTSRLRSISCGVRNLTRCGLNKGALILGLSAIRTQIHTENWSHGSDDVDWELELMVAIIIMKWRINVNSSMILDGEEIPKIGYFSILVVVCTRLIVKFLNWRECGYCLGREWGAILIWI